MEENWLHHFTTESRERKTYAWKRDIKSDLNIYGNDKCNGFDCFIFPNSLPLYYIKGSRNFQQMWTSKRLSKEVFFGGLLNWNQSLVSQTKQAKNKAATTAEKIVIL